MKKPSEQDIGKEVAYRPYPKAPLEWGNITKLGRNNLVFVRFYGEKQAKAVYWNRLATPPHAAEG